jgi:two-component system NtrC family response regulator
MRRVPRFPVNLDVNLLSGNITREGIISNLGLKGAFVNVKPSTDLNPLVTMQFSPPPNAHSRSLEVLARVVRNTPEGFGAEFLDLDAQHRNRLWSSLVSLWPKELKDCPYCGQHLVSKRKRCSLCHLPLDFQQEGYLDRLPEDTHGLREMIGTCPAMHKVFHLIRKVAASDVPVLVTGASGTGKEMVAQAIHQRSLRSKGPFVAVNCAAIPRELLESELFGHEKGAFTGAFRTVAGKVELAHNGTLFLDEVGELPLELQVKLLRFLQEFSFERVGGRETKQVDLRVISATNGDLKELIAAGRFREDLYYRLNVVNIDLPDLKERGDDGLIMANVFLRRYAAKTERKILGFSAEAMKAIQTYPWPGNIRELINHIRRAVVMAEDAWVTPENLGLDLTKFQGMPSNRLGLKEAKARFEAKLVSEALANCRGNVQLAAKLLKTSRSVVYHLISKHDLKEYMSMSQG